MKQLKIAAALLFIGAVAGTSSIHAQSMPFTNNFSSMGFPYVDSVGAWSLNTVAGVYSWTNSTTSAGATSTGITNAVSTNSFSLSTQFQLTAAGNGAPGGTDTAGFGALGTVVDFSSSTTGYYLADFVVANGSTEGTVNLGRLRILNRTSGVSATATVTQSEGGGGTLPNNAVTSIATNTLYSLTLNGQYSGSTLTLTLSLFNAAGTVQIGPSATLVQTAPLQGTNFGYRNAFGSGSGNLQFANFTIAPYSSPPTPVIFVTATTAQASRVAPNTNLVFAVSCSATPTTPLTLTYTLSGIAQENVDYYDYNGGSVTIPAGQTNATVTIGALYTDVPNGNDSVILTLNSGSGFILGNSSATGTILDDNEANVSAQYMFTETLAPQIWNPDMTVAAANPGNIGWAYSTTYSVSQNASFYVAGTSVTNNEAGSVAQNDYLSFIIGPVPGQTITLTNLNFQAIYGNYDDNDTSTTGAVVFVRSSVDNFSSDLGSFVLLPDTVNGPFWYSNSITLGNAFANDSSAIEFRLYFYDDTVNPNSVGVRIDNVYFSGSTAALPPNSVQVTVTNSIPYAAEPSTHGQFIVTSYGNTSQPVTVYYTMAGTPPYPASNGVDYVSLPGSVTIPAGQSNANIAVTPIDNDLPGPNRTATLTLTPNADYGILYPFSSLISIIQDTNVLAGMVVYQFNQNNDSVASLATVAAASISPSEANYINASNAAAGAGLGLFGGNFGDGNGYSSLYYYSPTSSLYISGSVVSSNEVGAVAGSNYVSFVIEPASGNSMSLTNFLTWVKITSPVSGSAYSLFLRSSADNFTSNITSMNMAAASGNQAGASFVPWVQSLNVTNDSSPVEFRIYVYGETNSITDNILLDDVTFQGYVLTAPIVIQSIQVSGGDATIKFSAGANDVGSDFYLLNAAIVTGPYTENNSAVITGSNGEFQAVVPINGQMMFYRLSRLP